MYGVEALLARLEQLGSVSRSGHIYRAACPVCARGQGDTALSVRLEGERVLMHCHRCETPYVELLAALGLGPRDLTPSSDWTPPARVKPTPNEAQRGKLERLWGEAFELDSRNVGGQYLASRGLSLERYPANVRVYGLLEYWEGGAVLGMYPALLSRVENWAGELMALHKTYLSPDGRGKAPVNPAKKFSSVVVQGGLMGAAVRLSSTGERLTVAEGVETALAVHQVTGWPTWAALSCGGMAAFQWPSSVRELLIAADNDPVNPKTGRRPGQAAAHTLSRRALEAGLTVKLALPPEPGTDWLDVLASEFKAVLS